jgi:hypothetical protein
MTNIEPKFDPYALMTNELPATAFTWLTGRTLFPAPSSNSVSSAIRLTFDITSRVRSALAASGSCTLQIMYPLSCCGMNPVGWVRNAATPAPTIAAYPISTSSGTRRLNPTAFTYHAFANPKAPVERPPEQRQRQEQGFQHAGGQRWAVGGRPRPLQQQRAQRRAERQRVERRKSWC